MARERISIDSVRNMSGRSCESVNAALWRELLFDKGSCRFLAMNVGLVAILLALPASVGECFMAEASRMREV